MGLLQPVIGREEHWFPKQWAEARRETFALELGARAVVVWPQTDRMVGNLVQVIVEPLGTAEATPTPLTHINKHKTVGDISWQ